MHAFMHYITLHYITLHYMSFHYITLHDIPLHDLTVPNIYTTYAQYCIIMLLHVIIIYYSHYTTRWLDAKQFDLDITWEE